MKKKKMFVLFLSLLVIFLFPQHNYKFIQNAELYHDGTHLNLAFTAVDSPRNFLDQILMFLGLKNYCRTILIRIDKESSIEKQMGNTSFQSSFIFERELCYGVTKKSLWREDRHILKTNKDLSVFYCIDKEKFLKRISEVKTEKIIDLRSDIGCDSVYKDKKSTLRRRYISDYRVDYLSYPDKSSSEIVIYYRDIEVYSFIM